VPVLGRLFRLIWGDHVDPPLRPVLAVTFASALAFSSVWSFIGIWAIDHLGASNSQLGVAFLFGAAAAAVGGYAGGHLSDHVGRKPLILAGFSVQSLFVVSFALAESVWVGLALLAVSGVFASIGGAASQALVADAVPPERHEPAYASVRVAQNLGVVMGPVIGGVLLLGEHWSRLFVGVAAMLVLAILIAWRLLPSRGAYAPEQSPERGSLPVIRRDRAFQLFMISAAFAWIVYVAYETVLPISAVDTYGLSPSTWGFLVIINPALVTLFQLRITRRFAHVPAGPKLVVAMLLMGFPFLLLSVNASIPVFAFVIGVFVLGEMLWVPTSQAIVAGLAPADLRGAYMGAFGSTAAVGFALGPFAGLQFRELSGDTAMWTFFAAVSVAAAVTGALAVAVALGKGRAPVEDLAAATSDA
jgi:predicted MFS family arabinose efflux permease